MTKESVFDMAAGREEPWRVGIEIEHGGEAVAAVPHEGAARIVSEVAPRGQVAFGIVDTCVASIAGEAVLVGGRVRVLNANH